MPLQDLNQMFSIVKPDGTPTDYFMRLLRDRKETSQTVEDQVTELDAQVTLLTSQLAAKADKTITISAGSGLAGGGDLSANRSLSLNAGIDLLTDVDTTTTPPTDGQSLVWEGASNLWKPLTITGGGGGGGGGSAIADLLHTELAKYVALNPTANLNQGTSIDKVKNNGGYVGLLFYANTLSGTPVAGTSYTVPTGYVAVCVGGHADTQIYSNPTFYKHRLYNVTTSQTVAGFEGGAYNRSDGWRIQYSGIMTSSSGGNPNNVSYPIVGVAGDVLRCEANSSGDGNYRVQCAEYYLIIVNATTGELYPTPGGGSGNPWWWNPPASTLFTYAGGDANTPTIIDSSNVGLRTSWTTPVGGDVMRILYQPLSNPSGDFEFVYRDEVLNEVLNYATPVVGIGNIGSSFRAYNNQYNGSLGYADQRYKTGFNGSGGGTGFGGYPSAGNKNVFVRWNKVGNQLASYISMDGESWLRTWTDTVAASFGGNNPDHVFFGVSYNRGYGQPIQTTVTCWSLTGTAV